jgi:hypothetical protein
MKQAQAYYLSVVRAAPGGSHARSMEIRFASLASARAAATKLQAEFDQDAEPARVYVVDEFNVPLEAAGCLPRKRT